MSYQDALSSLFLASLPFLAMIPVLNAVRAPSDYSLFEKVLYAPVYCLGRVLWRVEVDSRTKIAQRYPGGAVLVANHRCSLDPFFLQLAAGRRVHWMVAGEYFQNPIFGPILRSFQAIQTNRSGSDNASMKMAIRLAGEGRFVGMFPEGRINRSKLPLESVRSGAGMVCAKSQAPLIPCWIEGAPIGWAVWSGLFMPAHVRVFIGEPVTSESATDESIEEHNVDDLVEAAMRQSLDLGGHPRYPVVFAKHRRRGHSSSSE
jgi:1-acyl-sn-glycerol-3-phosphate acyltransferase